TDNDATSATFIVDTRAPTLTGTPTIGNPNLTRANQVTTITFVFSEQLDQASFTTADLTIPAGMGTLENLRTTDGGRSWQVDLRASANLAANTEAKDLQIGINMTGITDVAGNAGTGNVNLVTYTIDNKPPSATIAVTPNPVTSSNDRLVTVTITFDEAVTGFTADNIDFSNANVTPYGTNRIGTLNRSADGRTYTITYTAGPDVEDATNTVSLRNLDTIRDAAGNAATVSPTSNNFAIDTKAPVPTSATFDKTHLAAGETATVTVTFNEIVNNVTEDTFEIPNGSVSNLRQDTTDGRIWRATFTPTANLPSTSSSISINLNGLRDSVGNVNNGSLPFRDSTITIDTKRPEVTVTISDERLSAGETATVTFTFSERVTGFAAEDIQYDTSKGTLGALTAVGTDGRVWTATYTPSSSIESADNTIRVNLAGVQDAQGNAGTGTGSSGNFSIDTKRPTVDVSSGTFTSAHRRRSVRHQQRHAGRLTAVTISATTRPADTELADKPPREPQPSPSDRAASPLSSVHDGMGHRFTFNERGSRSQRRSVRHGNAGRLTGVATDGKVWTATTRPGPTPRAPTTPSAYVLDAQGNAGTVSSGNFSIDTSPRRSR
ncbi:Ig-like domain-containing protein, partial [Verminephrobacter eiseniae]|uniref:Ig-like domain-containing protein n=1 Tax=Verminephrobacter eiseniae TaxID=364317 RepID=UPI002AA2AF32